MITGDQYFAEAMKAYGVTHLFFVPTIMIPAMAAMEDIGITRVTCHDEKAAAWVKDKSWHPSQETKLLKDGKLKMTLKVADNEELLGWILSFGSQVKVVGPDELRRKIQEEAKKITD